MTVVLPIYDLSIARKPVFRVTLAALLDHIESMKAKVVYIAVHPNKYIITTDVTVIAVYSDYIITHVKHFNDAKEAVKYASKVKEIVEEVAPTVWFVDKGVKCEIPPNLA